MKRGDLKKKIIKINSNSIYIIISFFALFNFLIVYYVINLSFKQDVEITKKEYISSQKAIIKNQVNNFINFIIHTRKIEKELQIKNLQKNVKFLSQILSIANPKDFAYIIDKFQEENPYFKFGLSDINGNLVYTTASDYSKKNRLKLIYNQNQKHLVLNTKKGIKYVSIEKFTNNNKTYVIGSAIYQSTIDKIVKKIVLDRINSIKFGAKNNGYLSIAKILNYKGGKRFAQVVALPVKPEWIGKYLDDDKKDAKGKAYRKEYLKIANTAQEGYVSYWFFKKKTKTLKPKLSYVKLYKPYDWLIFTSVYLDDINELILQKEKSLKEELENILYYYIIVLLLFLIIAYFVTKYENKILLDIMEAYEKEIHSKNEELSILNNNLQKEVDKKTKQLFQNLFIEPLTKLPNREKLLLDFKSKKFIGILNIDGFKEINDFYGVEVGDKILKEVANALAHKEVMYKLSADEFAIMGDDINVLKDKILFLIEYIENFKFKIDNNYIDINLSAGIGDSLAKADMALKYAKKHKLKLVLFDEKLPIVKEYEEHIKWKNIINQAIKENKIFTYVQPLYNVKKHKVTKFECLIRLEYENKIYTPYFFLDIAKKTGQYQTLQKIIIKQSFEKFRDLDYKFSINLSLIDLINENFQEYFIKEIDNYNIANKLIIELLEDENIADERILKFLNKLREKGIKIAIDDFGSGYSNFEYLVTKLPVDILKIDGTLIKDINVDDKKYKLLKNIINMAKEFKFEIVVEFVEDEVIYKMLLPLDVDYLQGYYIGKPFDIKNLQS